MHKVWIRNSRKDTKVHSEKEWQIVTRTSFGKSVTDYNDTAKGPILTYTGTNELARNRTESPGVTKYDFNPYLDALRWKKTDQSCLDKLFRTSIKSNTKGHPRSLSNKIKKNTNDSSLPSTNDINRLKSLSDIRRELENANHGLKDFIGIEQKNDISQTSDNRLFPRLRRVCWDIIKYGSLLGIIFGILFLVIWYMMKKSGGTDRVS